MDNMLIVGQKYKANEEGLAFNYTVTRLREDCYYLITYIYDDVFGKIPNRAHIKPRMVVAASILYNGKVIGQDHFFMEHFLTTPSRKSIYED